MAGHTTDSMRNVVIAINDPLTREAICRDYHVWYYESWTWTKTKWMGIETMKAPTDMWLYQEIIFDLKPSLIVEFGTYKGGSAYYFAWLLRQMGHKSKILTVDPHDWEVEAKIKNDPLIEFMRSPSVHKDVKQRIADLKLEYPGPVFYILDGEHAFMNVVHELVMLQDLTVKGDYIIVEDSNINGHPIMVDVDGNRDYTKFPGGPYEAILYYEQSHPDHYAHDIQREQKFGFTFAPYGFLIRQ